MTFKTSLRRLRVKNSFTNVKFSVSCCRVRGVFQVLQAACGQSVTCHSLPEDAFKIPTCSVVIFQVARYLQRLAGNGNALRVKEHTFALLNYSMKLVLPIV